MSKKVSFAEERLSYNLNEINEMILELSTEGFNLKTLMKLRSRLIQAAYWSDCFIAEMSKRRKKREVISCKRV